ncbi:hypothetical protein HOI71_01120, partial [Candidatus Poribacteria bacterium]|nr:hypothetical protein [Candidatus Poribacteria bacterium]
TVAFARHSGFEPQVHLMDPSGANIRRLTSGPGSNAHPAWSPDGATIAFVSTRDGRGQIYVMDADGGDHRRLTTHPGTDAAPAWSP